MYILTDVDDTVLEFGDSFQKWAEDRGHVPRGRVRNIGDIATVFDMETDDGIVEDYFHAAAFGEMTPEPDALDVLPRLHKLGVKFVAITACSDHPNVIAKRTRNLEEAFGFKWEAVHCTGVHRPKVTLLNAYKPSVWVEDNPIHAVVGAELGHQTFLLDRPYNQSLIHPKVSRITDWYEIERRITV